MIYNGDCYELIKNIPDKSIDLILTDPPFLIVGGGQGGCFGTEHRDYHEQYKKLYCNEHKQTGIKTDPNTDNKNCICAGFDYSLLNEFDRVLKKINVYIFCNKNQISALMSHYENLGCNVDLLVWKKLNPIPTVNNKYLSDLEYCVFAREPGTPLYGTYETKSKLYTSSTNTDDKNKYYHPCCKPVELLERYIINSTKPGDTVLDPFAGSGSTLIAAKHLNRNYIGFEIDEKYFKICQDRLDGWDQNGEMNLLDL